jgi:hypothetical protein
MPKAWPRDDQDELAEYAREIEARRTGIYTMSDEEQAAVGKGLAEADQGKFSGDKKPTATESKKLAASILSLDEKKGQRR